jgi:histidinol-phosphate aminotransferase
VNINALARPEVLAMRAYESARNTAAADGVLLNANEAPGPLLDDPAWQALQINRYPNPQPQELLERLAGLYGVSQAQLLVTRGSDEGIDLLLRVFCQAGKDAILECPPCFGMYRIAAQIQGALCVQVPRQADSLALDFAAVEQAIADTPQLKLVFLTSPNNPTGDTISPAQLEGILQACAERALVVLDEAYIEFCPGGLAPENTAVALLARYPNLVVLRTLSKAWAAAGLRCGSVLAAPEVISLLRRVMAPYPLTAPAIAAALAVTGPQAQQRQAGMLAMVERNKQQLLAYLAQQAWVTRHWSGEANFILTRVADAPGLVAFCAAAGVRIRDFSTQRGLEGCVRFSIGNNDDMQALYRALDAYGASL